SDLLSTLTALPFAARTQEAPPPALQRHGVPLHIDGLSKCYGARTVLDQVRLSLRAGEFVAVVGRSGCGKSTLLRAIAGLEKPDGGQVKIGGGEGKGSKRPELRMMF